MSRTEDPLATLTPEQSKALREWAAEVSGRLENLEKKLLQITERLGEKKGNDA